MRDIDLIPDDYVQARRVRRLLAVFGAALLLLALVTAGLRGWVAVQLKSERGAAEQARLRQGAVGVQRARLAALQAMRDAGDAQRATLNMLTDARPADALWTAVDSAYNPGIWLDAMSYARTTRSEAAVAPGSPPGAPVPVPAASPVLRHEVELRGHALNHAALTEFRRALSERPGVATVRLAESGLQQYAGRDAVRFTLAATLVPAPAATASAANSGSWAEAHAKAPVPALPAMPGTP